MARLLLIEDNNELREMLHTTLAEKGHTIVEARDGKEGMKAYSSDKFDVVITDILMPNKDGIETIFELRHMHPGVRIIAITGGGAIMSVKDCAEIAKNLGIKHVLKKPFNIATLDTCIAYEMA